MTIIVFFFFNDTATTEIYTLSLHDALPIYQPLPRGPGGLAEAVLPRLPQQVRNTDRKSTRLNSSHDQISYAVFCLKKKNITEGTKTQKTHILDIAAEKIEPSRSKL